jgi:hypothetical protein
VSKQGVSGIYDSMSKAEEAVYTLDRGGFPIKQVSIVAQNLQSERRVNGYVTISDVGRTGAMTGAWFVGTGWGLYDALAPETRAVVGRVRRRS